MDGLINRAIESFAQETYGDAFWHDLMQGLGLQFVSFEATLDYDAKVTEQVVGALARALGQSPDEVLEDLGTFLVASPRTYAIRRLLRFSGADFVEFLYSLDDLPARVRLALPEFDMPQIELREHANGAFSLRVEMVPAFRMGLAHVMVGLLRAMADDYGALVYLEHRGVNGRDEIIGITLLESAFTEARAFALADRGT